MSKIKMANPIVEMDGDEMTRVLWKIIKEDLLLPFVDLNMEYYDLGLPERDKTGDKVTWQAAEAIKKIDYIYHIDNKYKESSEEEILDNRQKSVKPLVDAYFAWVKETLSKPGLDKSSKLVTALNYSQNQEKYLRVFLDDPKLPLDNNDAERSIKKFCVGKKNWQIIDSKNGAEASAMMYSLAETIKANGLKPYEYFSYLLSQLKEHPRNNVPEDVLADLMPWSDKLPDECRKNKTR